jgi:transposase
MHGAHADCPPLPPDTARAGRAAFGAVHPFIAIGDRLESYCLGLDWRRLELWPATAIHALITNTLVTTLQYIEDLSDRQAAEATRTRTDWKYALHLPLAYPGLRPERLASFRRNLGADPSGQEVCAQLLQRLLADGLPFPADLQVTKFSSVLERIECRQCADRACEAMCQAVESLAAEEPDWLRDHGLPHWFERYAQPGVPVRLPAGQPERRTWLQQTYADVDYMLHTLDATGHPTVRERLQFDLGGRSPLGSRPGDALRGGMTH